ncbi:MAG: glycosyltransferase family 39 protein [Candidatus Omnitrophica bacterium]|nr:glycosyltransferase family 39 protein [Candidatus Omnitrophota bacterium]
MIQTDEVSKLGNIFKKYSDIIALSVIIFAFFLYIYNISGWLINDDEGTFLYISWKVSEGKVLYRDIPAFNKPPLLFYIGAGLFKFFQTRILFYRLLSTIVTLIGAFFVYLIAKKIYNFRVAILSLLLYLIHPMIFEQARFFMPDCYFLLFTIVTLYLFMKGYDKNNKIFFLLSGFMLGLSFLFKLIAVVPFIGYLIFFFYIAITNKRKFTDALSYCLIMGFGFLSITSIISIIFYFLSPDLFQQTIGHHLNLGRDLPLLSVFKKNLNFFCQYFKYYLLLVAPAALVAIRNLVKKEDKRQIFSFLLLTILLFLGIRRELYFRHLMYLLPIFVILSSSFFAYLFNHRNHFLKLTSIILVSVFCYKCINTALFILSKKDKDTKILVNYIKSQTQRENYVLADYAGLNFYSQRDGPPIIGNLCGTATKSGQIKAKDLIEEIKKYNVRLILIHTKGEGNFFRGRPDKNRLSFGPHHFANLSDYKKFIAYVKENYSYKRIFNREGQLLEIFARNQINR